MTRLEDTKIRMYELLTSGAGLQQILECAESFLENPIAITTAALDVLAYSTSIPVHDEIWDTVIVGSSGRYDFYTRLKEMNLLDSLGTSPLMMIDDKEVAERRWLAGYIQFRNEYIGQIVIVESVRQFSDSDEELLLTFCGICAFFMSTERSVLNKYDTRAEVILLDLVSGKTIPEGLIRERLVRIPWDKNIRHRVIIMTPDRNAEYNLHPLKARFLDVDPYSCGIVTKNQLIFLSTWECSRHDPITDPAFSAFVKEHQLIAGISVSFISISEFYNHFLQAADALTLAHHLDLDGRVFRFNDLAAESMFETTATQRDLSLYYHESLKSILEYDETYNTNYLRDLYVYLSTDGNINKTSELLHIHRNTVKYRISKLEELFEIDFDDPDMVFSLKFSLKILRYIEGSAFFTTHRISI